MPDDKPAQCPQCENKRLMVFMTTDPIELRPNEFTTMKLFFCRDCNTIWSPRTPQHNYIEWREE